MIVSHMPAKSLPKGSTRGRPRDLSLDETIIGATIEILIRDGYDRLSMEGVAPAAGVGKATLYRRWGSKTELVIDALASFKPAKASINSSSLDGDIDLAVIASCSASSQRLSWVLLSVCSALRREPELLKAFRTCFAEVLIAPIAEILERARTRGELGLDVDVGLAAGLVPSLMLQRALMTGEPVGRDYAEQIVRSVLLPTLGRPHQSSSIGDSVAR